MKYMGSKARIAKDISPIINQIIKENGITTYIEPFVGGANMIQHIECVRRVGCDNNKYLIAFWKRIQEGWNPLKEFEMNEQYYKFIREDPDHYEPEYVALAGFCASYNAKWFGGYAGIVKTKINTYRNYYDEAVRNVLKQAPHIKSVDFVFADYRSLDIEQALIYCDPPYEGTTGYKDDFDHYAYWEWVRKMSEKNIVLCSEYSAPPDFECIWSKQLTTTLDKASRSKAVEKLFVIKKQKEKKEMELRIEPYTTPEQISFNYEELKEMLLQKASHYETLVYTDDQIKDAKADRANLNRLKKALNDERIRREKEYMESFNVFKAQINEIISIIDKPCGIIDSRIKEFEEAQKAEKFKEIEAYWHELLRADKIPAGICFNSLYNEKWLNASVKMPAIVKEITERLEQIEKDLAVIENLPAYAFEAKEVYNSTLDLGKAVSEANRLRELAEKKAAWVAEQEKRKAEAEAAAIKPAEPVDIPCTPTPEAAPGKQWIGFKALLSVDDAKALKEFFISRGIEYKSI